MIPPDLNRCQAEKTADYTFMTLGGRVGEMVQCSNKPVLIAIEKKPGSDGKCGSMSLCKECAAELTKRMPDYATFQSMKS